MAKKSKVARDRQRRAVVARYAERRAELKEIIRSSPEQRADAQLALQRLPRDASPTRLRNRDGSHNFSFRQERRLWRIRPTRSVAGWNRRLLLLWTEMSN